MMCQLLLASSSEKLPPSLTVTKELNDFPVPSGFASKFNLVETRDSVDECVKGESGTVSKDAAERKSGIRLVAGKDICRARSGNICSFAS
ncbi:hypothetical protein Q3G72_003721 [Acer saccharum]|nr:hypothetical protein Q3G72_003721 [Acer saccharum]